MFRVYRLSRGGNRAKVHINDRGRDRLVKGRTSEEQGRKRGNIYTLRMSFAAVKYIVMCK